MLAALLYKFKSTAEIHSLMLQDAALLAVLAVS